MKSEGFEYIDFASGAKSMKQKIEGFHEALKSDADLVWFVRGGYSCIQALPLINWNLVQESKKSFYGLSDFTHFAWMAISRGVPVFYGQSLTSFGKYFPLAADREFLFSFLRTGRLSPLFLNPLTPSSASIDLSLTPMIGGHATLTLLMLLQYPIDLHDRFLFLEYHPGGVGEGMRDIGYYLENLIQALQRTNNLPKGFVFGQSMLPQPDGSMIPWREINVFCAERVSHLNLPVYEVDHFKHVIPFQAFDQQSDVSEAE
ncbi:MAG: LD-carboxypeptidase [Candidatus Uhrbacteria bacterium]|nr:LD-carboxypeptidase [Candidatus Uhrbacteria bacterium]